MFCDGRVEDHSRCVQGWLSVLTRLKVRVHERLVPGATSQINFGNGSVLTTQNQRIQTADVKQAKRLTSNEAYSLREQ